MEHLWSCPIQADDKETNLPFAFLGQICFPQGAPISWTQSFPPSFPTRRLPAKTMPTSGCWSCSTPAPSGSSPSRFLFWKSFPSSERNKKVCCKMVSISQQTFCFCVILLVYAAALAALSACGSASRRFRFRRCCPLPRWRLRPPRTRRRSQRAFRRRWRGWRPAPRCLHHGRLGGSGRAVDSGFVSLSVRPVRYQLPLWRLNR